MRQKIIIIASLLVFLVTATAQAADTDPRVSPIASPIVRPDSTIQQAAPTEYGGVVLSIVPLTADDWKAFTK